MDYWSRIFIAVILGVALGLGISHFLGDPFVWVFISLAISLATETSLRTIKNVKGTQNPVLKQASANFKPGKLKLPKPGKPKF